jgi:hypothetical protein
MRDRAAPLVRRASSAMSYGLTSPQRGRHSAAPQRLFDTQRRARAELADERAQPSTTAWPARGG